MLIALDRIDDGLDWLDRAYEELDAGLVFLNVDPRLETLRPHPRIRPLIRKTKLGE